MHSAIFVLNALYDIGSTSREKALSAEQKSLLKSMKLLMVGFWRVLVVNEPVPPVLSSGCRMSLTSWTNALRVLTTATYFALSRYVAAVLRILFISASSDLSTSTVPPLTSNPFLRTFSTAFRIVLMLSWISAISATPSVLPPSSAKSASLPTSGPSLSFIFWTASAVPCIRIASRGISSLNFALSIAVTFASGTVLLTAFCWTTSCIRTATE